MVVVSCLLKKSETAIFDKELGESDSTENSLKLYIEPKYRARKYQRTSVRREPRAPGHKKYFSYANLKKKARAYDLVPYV
jgi:hypothetical protein